jgi:hypothetical protein
MASVSSAHSRAARRAQAAVKPRWQQGHEATGDATLLRG